MTWILSRTESNRVEPSRTESVQTRVDHQFREITIGCETDTTDVMAVFGSESLEEANKMGDFHQDTRRIPLRNPEA